MLGLGLHNNSLTVYCKCSYCYLLTFVVRSNARSKTTITVQPVLVFFYCLLYNFRLCEGCFLSVETRCHAVPYRRKATKQKALCLCRLHNRTTLQNDGLRKRTTATWCTSNYARNIVQRLSNAVLTFLRPIFGPDRTMVYFFQEFFPVPFLLSACHVLPDFRQDITI